MSINKPKAGGVPHLVSAEENDWYEIVIDCKTLDETSTAGPIDEKTGKGKWNAYICNALWDDEEVEDFEICFWAMKPFWELYEEAGEPTKGKWTILYKRKEDKKGNNVAQFKEV